MVSALAVDSSDRLISGGWDKTVPWPLEKVDRDQMDVRRYWIDLDCGLFFCFLLEGSICFVYSTFWGRGRYGDYLPFPKVRLWENHTQKSVMSGHEIAVNAVAGVSLGGEGSQ